MNFEIGVSGLRASQGALELISTNLANATTEGYHLQRIKLSAVTVGSGDQKLRTGGVAVDGASRAYNNLVEQQILLETSKHAENAEELEKLQGIESQLCQLENNILSGSVSDFFSSLSELSADPTSVPYAQQAAWTAENLATNMRHAGEFLDRLKGEIKAEVESVINNLNAKAIKVSELNTEIATIETQGFNTNVLQDQRDQMIKELTEIADVDVTRTDNGKVTVSAYGIPIVTSSKAVAIESGLNHDSELGLSPVDHFNYHVNLSGGKLGGLLNMYNNVVPSVEDRINLLASEIIHGLNAIHAEGVTINGSFTDLKGTKEILATDVLDTLTPPITSGDLHIRLTDTATGISTVKSITIDPSTDTVADIMTALEAVDDAPAETVIPDDTLHANLVDGRLHVWTTNNYEFDFLPDYTTDLTGFAGTGGGVNAPTIEPIGIYEGANQQYTATVVGSGEVGIDNDLFLEIKNGAGATVTTVSVGNGYSAGDLFDVESNIRLSISQGTLNNGEVITIDALSKSDETGFLACTGLNSMFEGDSAITMQLRDGFTESPMMINSCLGTTTTDNRNIQRMFDFGTDENAALDNNTVTGYHQQTITQIGQMVQIREARHTASGQIIDELVNRRDVISGVDPNEQAAMLIMYQRMFQSMSKTISVMDESIDTLMQIIK